MLVLVMFPDLLQSPLLDQPLCDSNGGSRLPYSYASLVWTSAWHTGGAQEYVPS